MHTTIENSSSSSWVWSSSSCSSWTLWSPPPALPGHCGLLLFLLLGRSWGTQGPGKVAGLRNELAICKARMGQV